MKFNLGKVSLMPRGEYDPLLTYAKLDIVTYRGSAYVVLKDDVTGVVPSNDKVNYFLLVEKGEPYTHSEEFEKLVASLAETETRVNEIKLAIEESAKKFADDYDQKLQDFNSNHTQKLQAYNDNADFKIQSLEEKYTNFNKNANQKSQEYNDNAKLKVQEYNTNHAQKVQKYNDNAVKANEAIDLQIAKATQEANRAETNASKSEVLMRSVPKLKVEGNPIILNDTIEQKVMDVLPYIEQPVIFAKGSTTQDGVPAFENSIDFKNSEITAIISAKKNLFNEKYKVGFYDTQGAFNSGLTDRKCSDILPTFGAKNLSFSVSSEKQSIACIICLYKKSKLIYRQSYVLEEFTVDTRNADSYSISVYGKGEDDSNNIDTNYLQIMCVAGTEPAKYEKSEGEIINLTQPITLSEFDSIEIRENVVGHFIKSYSEIFDGSDDEKVDLRTTSVYPLRMGIVLEKNTILNDKCYSNMLLFEKNGSRMNTIFTNGNVALIVQNKFKSAEEFKKWLQTNPLKIMYQLAEPTFEPLPEADQQSILNMVIQAPNATIMTDSGITLSINYIADTKKWVLKQVKTLSEEILQTQKALLK